jgi:hypothetical protein
MNKLDLHSLEATELYTDFWTNFKRDRVDKKNLPGTLLAAEKTWRPDFGAETDVIHCGSHLTSAACNVYNFLLFLGALFLSIVGSMALSLLMRDAYKWING